jgi:RNA polymerase sigma-70 factor (ECF subfamily)
MKNTFINDYRRKNNFKVINGNDGLSVLNQIKSGPVHDPASMLESKELEKIIESIDEKLKVPFKMQYEGYTYSEIAEILDLKVGTVKSKIFIARRKLMKQLNLFSGKNNKNVSNTNF